MKRKRILLYSHDTYGLGHLRRNLLLCERFCRFDEEPAVLIATGSPRTQAFDLPDRCDTFKLPAVTKSSDGGYVPRTLPVTIEQLTRMRADLIVSAYRAFDPDLILVDHAPTGMRGELLPLFREIECDKARRGLKLVLGLRDIIDDADRVRTEWDEQDAWRWLESIYDRVLVYGDRRVRTTAMDLGLEERFPGKIAHVGYLGRREFLGEDPASCDGRLVDPTSVGAQSTGPASNGASNASPRLGPDEEPTILVTTGGGGDGQAVLRSFVEYLEQLDAPAPFRSILVTGPFLSRLRYREICDRVAATRQPVELFRFTNRLPYYLQRASGVISMAGYNSATEILASRIPCLLVPRSEPRLEQTLRVERLRAVAEIESVRMQDLDARAIGRFVDAVIARSERCAEPRIELNGLARTAREIHRLLFGGASEESPTRVPGAERSSAEASESSRSTRGELRELRKTVRAQHPPRKTLLTRIEARVLRLSHFARRCIDVPFGS